MSFTPALLKHLTSLKVTSEGYEKLMGALDREASQIVGEVDARSSNVRFNKRTLRVLQEQVSELENRIAEEEHAVEHLKSKAEGILKRAEAADEDHKKVKAEIKQVKEAIR